MKHRRPRLIPECHWKNAVAVFMAAVTAGAWIPFVTDPYDAVETDDEEESYSVPPPLYETHAPQSWPQTVVPRVDLTKHPRPVKNPATDPTHSQPTPKVPIRLPKPTTRPASEEQALVAFLKAQLGKPYVFGGNGPNVYDCSGLTRAAYEHVGWHLPRTSEAQSLVGTRVSLSELRVGDLLFWGAAPGLAFHVAIYIGGGKYIAAQNPRVGVVERYVSGYEPNFARRIL